MSPFPSPSWSLLTRLLLLSFVPVVAGAARLLWLAGWAGGGAVTPDNARFMASPGPMAWHVVSASVFCVLGAFQFDSAIRLRYPRLHRISGRVVAPCGVLAALTGLWMTTRSDIPAALQGSLLCGVRVLVGLAMMLAIALSIRAVLHGRIAAHKAWMIRAYALGQGAGTQVLIMLPMSMIVGAPTFLLRDVLMASAWALNVIFAEWLIRRRLPSA